jgi:PAS domain S-box-containing protein
MPGEAGKTLLLVEDETVIAMNQEMLLSGHGFEVITVADGESAVEMVRSRPDIDLILMDIDLGAGIDGTTAATQILQLRELPIVFLTSHSERSVVQKVKGITRYGYVLKNAGEFVLLEAIAMAFELFDVVTRLRESERRYRLIADNTNDGVGLIENDVLTYCSPAYERMLGYDPAELTNLSLGEIFSRIHSEDAERIRRIVREAKERREPSLRYRYRALGKDGTYRWVEDNVRLHYDAQGKRTRSFVTTRDISQQKRAEDELAAREREYRALFDGADNPITVYDIEATIINLNDAAARTLGRPREEILGRPLRDFVPETHDLTVRRIREYLDEGGVKRYTERIRLPSGEYRWFRSFFHLLPTDENRPPRVQVISYDITEHKRAQNHLVEREERYETLFESAKDAILIMRGETVVDCNSASVLLYRGTSKNDLLGKRPWDLSPEYQADGTLSREKAAAYVEFALAGESQQFEWLSTTVDGEPFHAEISLNSIRIESDTYIQAMVRDATARKVAEKQLERAVREKEELMRELNHRVKNNLSMVNSLLSLKDAAVGDAADLSDIRRQVDAITRVHEKLSRAEGPLEIEMGDYVRQLVDAVFGAVEGEEVRRHVRTNGVSLPAKIAVPVALVINEIATNAAKHGFHERGRNEFSVDLSLDESKGDYTLILSNSGRPFPSDIDINAPKTLGLQLVTALVGQLGGSMELVRSPHPTYTVRFPIPR